MNSYDLNNCWFISDLHFSSEYKNKLGQPRGIRLFERTQFSSIEEHDNFIIGKIEEFLSKHAGITLFILGDFGDTDYLHYIAEWREKYEVKIVFLYGNHDKLDDLPLFKNAFDEVYLYPTYIAPRVLISHEPQFPAPEGVINIHGHLHTANLDLPQYVNVSIHMINYHPIGNKTIAKRFSKISKPSFKFLEEPYVRHLVYNKKRPDIVLLDDKRLDYEKTIEKINSDRKTNIVPRERVIIEY